MKKLLYLFTLAIMPLHIQADYVKFGTRLEKNIRIPGYRTFDYTFWLHPGMGNKEVQNLFTKKILDFLSKIIPERSVAIDIGAHAGDTAVLYSLVVGESGKVIAFEPNPSCFEVLQMNANNNKNIIPIKKAVTERDGNYTFYYTDPGLCNGAYAEMLSIHPYRTPVPVEGANLENWLEQNCKNLISKIKFIKIDTEGYDRYIIKSIKGLLIKQRPIIQCELFIYLNAKEKEEMFTILDCLNYKIFLGAYEGAIDTTPLGTRKQFDLKSFVEYQVPEGSIDLLCIPAELDFTF